MTRTYEVPEPVYDPKLPPTIAEEAKKAWMDGRPYTRIRPHRGASEGLEDPICVGAVGSSTICGEDATHVQFSTAFGDALTYCEKCAKHQAKWDDILYADCKPHNHDYTATSSEEDQGKTLLELIHGVKKVSDMTPEELEEHKRRKREEREDEDV